MNELGAHWSVRYVQRRRTMVFIRFKVDCSENGKHGLFEIVARTGP